MLKRLVERGRLAEEGDRGLAVRVPRLSGRGGILRAEGCEEFAEAVRGPGRGEVVVVIARADDLAVADAEHEDGGQRVRLSGVGRGSLVFELGDDDLGIGCLVDRDVAHPAARPGPGGGELLHTLAELIANAQQAGAVRDDVELPEVYALLVGASRAAARARLDKEARTRLFAIVFDGLAPRPRYAEQDGRQRLRPGP